MLGRFYINSTEYGTLALMAICIVVTAELFSRAPVWMPGCSSGIFGHLDEQFNVGRRRDQGQARCGAFERD